MIRWAREAPLCPVPHEIRPTVNPAAMRDEETNEATSELLVSTVPTGRPPTTGAVNPQLARVRLGVNPDDTSGKTRDHILRTKKLSYELPQRRAKGLSDILGKGLVGRHYHRPRGRRGAYFARRHLGSGLLS